MLEINPALLLKRIKVENYSFRTIIGTPFQLALGTLDDRIANPVKLPVY